MSPRRRAPRQPERSEPTGPPDDFEQEITPDGRRLPRVLPDIPCRHCNQYPRCVAEERCLGPLAPEPSRRPPSEPDEAMRWYGGKPDPAAQPPHVGESYLPGGGQLRNLRRGVLEALGVIASVDLQAGEAADTVYDHLRVLKAVTEGTENPHAIGMIHAMHDAHRAGTLVSQALAVALERLTQYHDGLLPGSG